jgi:hypothetical protein
LGAPNTSTAAIGNSGNMSHHASGSSRKCFGFAGLLGGSSSLGLITAGHAHVAQVSTCASLALVHLLHVHLYPGPDTG